MSRPDARVAAPTRRLRDCVEAWPEAVTGGYDPRCCRFPKSCSATIYDEDRVAEEDLEPALPVVAAPVNAVPAPRQAAYDAVFAAIGRLREQMPADPVRRNAMIWRIVEDALDAYEGQAADECRRCPGLALELAATRQMLDVMTAPDAPSKPCPRIAHESGVVMACMLDHESGYSATHHANPAHRATWDEDDDRIVAGGDR